MLDFYIHQIGPIYNEKTYDRLQKILDCKKIYSREMLEKMGIEFNHENQSFKLNIPPNKEWMYYEDDIHKDRVSLLDPHNIIVKKAIENKIHQGFTCFDYDYIGFAISRDVITISKEETHGLALGEVQVKNEVDSEFIMGLIFPFTQDDLLKSSTQSILEMLSTMCEKSNFPLDIYNYEGELIKPKKEGKCK